ncbi:unnamed protein product, partial [Phaeothamnion confervicola]
RRRNLVASHLPVSAKARMESRKENETSVGLQADDGLCVELLRIAPNRSMSISDISLGYGASMLVAAGEVICSNKVYGTWSCLYASREEPPFELIASQNGAEVLFMRYP